MDQLIAIVLNDKDLLIKCYKDQKGNIVYVGTSDRYSPYYATSKSSALQCLFKFNIMLDDQKRLGSLIESHDV